MPIENHTIARPYAKAAFQYAVKHQALDAWSLLLNTAAYICNDRQVAQLIANPQATLEQIQQLLIELCHPLLDEHQRNFLVWLTQQRRLLVLSEIAQLYDAMRAEHERKAEVKVRSFLPLSAEQQQKIISALKQRLAREITLVCETDPTLLGGAVIRAGDFVIDGSVRGKLQRLTDEIAI